MQAQTVLSQDEIVLAAAVLKMLEGFEKQSEFYYFCCYSEEFDKFYDNRNNRIKIRRLACKYKETTENDEIGIPSSSAKILFWAYSREERFQRRFSFLDFLREQLNLKSLY